MVTFHISSRKSSTKTVSWLERVTCSYIPPSLPPSEPSPALLLQTRPSTPYLLPQTQRSRLPGLLHQSQESRFQPSSLSPGGSDLIRYPPPDPVIRLKEHTKLAISCPISPPGLAPPRSAHPGRLVGCRFLVPRGTECHWQDQRDRGPGSETQVWVFLHLSEELDRGWRDNPMG